MSTFMSFLNLRSVECTFIILDRKQYEAEDGKNEEKSMVGDTNLFLNVQEEEEEDASVGSWAEIEIMIAEKTARRQGFAREALKLMMKYGMHTHMPQIMPIGSII